MNVRGWPPRVSMKCGYLKMLRRVMTFSTLIPSLILPASFIFTFRIFIVHHNDSHDLSSIINIIIDSLSIHVCPILSSIFRFHVGLVWMWAVCIQ